MKHIETGFCVVAALAMAACNVTSATNEAVNANNGEPSDTQAPLDLPSQAPSPSSPANSAQPTSIPPQPGTPGGLPDDRSPLPEPTGPIDPKSSEAAGQVVQSYGALTESGRFAAAEKLWNNAGAAAAATARIRPNRETHFQIGKPGNPDGAAGSIYVSVPVVIYGKRADGKSFSAKGDVVLRRVNDVPGSTSQQRRWHIQSLDVAGL